MQSVMAVNFQGVWRGCQVFGRRLIAPGVVGSEVIPEPMRLKGMPVDEFAAISLPQMLAGEPYVVFHGYNQVRIEELHRQIADAYQKSAPRREGDERYDVALLLKPLGH